SKLIVTVFEYSSVVSEGQIMDPSDASFEQRAPIHNVALIESSRIPSSIMFLESGTYIISSVSCDAALSVLPFDNDGDSMPQSIGTLGKRDTAPKWKIVAGRDSSGKEVYHIHLKGVGRAVSHNHLF
ncbi:hypothetical protein EST38_g11092, partial [Candolleomyces aberdarensis]